LKRKGFPKKATSIETLVGCTIEALKSHLESQFAVGMSWENHGVGWHVDHIKALAHAKTPEEMAELFKWSNLQPLWGPDNLRKGAK
jgi:hypothetical protein